MSKIAQKLQMGLIFEIIGKLLQKEEPFLKSTAQICSKIDANFLTPCYPFYVNIIIYLSQDFCSYLHTGSTVYYGSFKAKCCGLN